MSNSNTKERRDESAPGAKRSLTTPSAPSSVADRELSALWKAEVEELRARQFSSVDEAVEAVVDAILQRLGSSKGEERAFLHTLFASDPELRERLRAEFGL